MLPELDPTEMVEPGTGRTCLVRGKDVPEFRRRGYSLAAEPITDGPRAENEPAASTEEDISGEPESAAVTGGGLPRAMKAGGRRTGRR